MVSAQRGTGATMSWEELIGPTTVKFLRVQAL